MALSPNKGGRNPEVSQIKERPPAPSPMSVGPRTILEGTVFTVAAYPLSVAEKYAETTPDALSSQLRSDISVMAKELRYWHAKFAEIEREHSDAKKALA